MPCKQGIHTSVDLVHTLSVVPSAKKQHVHARSLTNERDLSEVRPCAPVRATSHTHDNGIVAKTVGLADLLNLVDEDREVLRYKVSVMID